MHHIFIRAMAEAINAKSYLELGLYKGTTFSSIAPIVETCVGVDTKQYFTPQKGKIHISTTENFFQHNTDTFDLIFIDADHSFESAKNDLLWSLNVLNPYGVIILHDTDPNKNELLTSGYCGDSYRIVDWVRTNRSDLDIITLPLGDPGISIVKRTGDRRVLPFIAADMKNV